MAGIRGFAERAARRESGAGDGRRGERCRYTAGVHTTAELLSTLRAALTACFQPLGACILLALAGAAFKRRWLAGAALILLIAASTDVVSRQLAAILESGYPPVEVGACPEADAAVVLGGILADDPRTAALEWGASVNRFERGLDLLKMKRVRQVVFTRAKAGWLPPGEPDEGTLLKQAAESRGFEPATILLTEGTVGTTFDEAREAGRLAAKRGWKKVVVVTSVFHLARATYIFRAAGVEVVPFPAEFYAGPKARWTPLDLIPNSNALRISDAVARELIGLAYYRLRSLAGG